MLNPESLLILLEDDDSVVQSELDHHFKVNATLSSLTILESLFSIIPDSRKNRLFEIYRRTKYHWFLTTFRHYCSENNIENLQLLQNTYLGINALFNELIPVLDSTVIIENLISDFQEQGSELSDPIEQLNLLNKIVFKDHRYTGNINQYYAPENSDLSAVLKYHTGIPLTLSVLYYMIGKSQTIPLYLAEIPRHFMIYVNINHPFFIDPFNQGKFLSVKEVHGFLSEINHSKNIESYLHVSAISLMKRTLANLLHIYTQNLNQEMIGKIETLHTIMLEFE